MKVDEYTLRGVNRNVREFIDQATIIFNFGKYSAQTLTSEPTWVARNGEFAFLQSSSQNRVYFYANNQWNWLAGGAGGASAAGSHTMVQFNSSGFFGADSGFLYRELPVGRASLGNIARINQPTPNTAKSWFVGAGINEQFLNLRVTDTGASASKAGLMVGYVANPTDNSTTYDVVAGAFHLEVETGNINRTVGDFVGVMGEVYAIGSSTDYQMIASVYGKTLVTDSAFTLGGGAAGGCFGGLFLSDVPYGTGIATVSIQANPAPQVPPNSSIGLHIDQHRIPTALAERGRERMNVYSEGFATAFLTYNDALNYLQSPVMIAGKPQNEGSRASFQIRNDATGHIMAGSGLVSGTANTYVVIGSGLDFRKFLKPSQNILTFPALADPGQMIEITGRAYLISSINGVLEITLAEALENTFTNQSWQMKYPSVLIWSNIGTSNNVEPTSNLAASFLITANKGRVGIHNPYPLHSLDVGGTIKCNGLILGGSTTSTITTIISGSANISFPGVPASSATDMTIGIVGAITDDTVILGIPNSAISAGSNCTNCSFIAWVPSNDAVTVRLINNHSGFVADAATGTYKLTIVRA